jgi:hypothetical protein
LVGRSRRGGKNFEEDVPSSVLLTYPVLFAFVIDSLQPWVQRDSEKAALEHPE